MPKVNQSVSRPVPGGKSQRSKTGETPQPLGGSTSPRVGSKRGEVGTGTIDRHNRTPSQQGARIRGASGNYGGGYAYRDGRIPGNARRSG